MPPTIQPRLGDVLGSVSTYQALETGGKQRSPHDSRSNGVLGLKRILIISAVVAASLLFLAALGLLILWQASQIVPDFYAEVLAIDPAEQRTASDTMIQKATVLVSDVQKTGRWEALFSEQEVNAWLSVDLEENHQNSLPSGVDDPRVAIEPGGLQMACRARRGGIETILSVSLDIYLVEPGVLGIRIRRVRAGAVPLPLADVLELIRDVGDKQGLHIRWQQAEGDPVAIVRINPVVKGDKSVLIDNLELAEGEIYMSGSTEKPTESRD